MRQLAEFLCKIFIVNKVFPLFLFLVNKLITSSHSSYFLHKKYCSVYNVTIDENTPPGLTIYRGIQAIDIDKPNTPNSDVRYSIVSGNEDRKFSIEGNQKAVVVLRKALDFEKGDSLFNMTILAEVLG